MSSCSTDQLDDEKNAPPCVSKTVEGGEMSLEVREDEDEEDVDFNPYLNETHSAEASSSLSSEVEGLDADVVDSRESASASREIDSLKLRAEVQGSSVRDPGFDKDEIVMQNGVGSADNKELEENNKRTALSESECEVVTGQERNDSLHGAIDGNDAGVDVVAGESDRMNSRNLILDFDDDDAICKRTRARYSLASFTLDELETFLQETDDEDDLQNVDDEEEYKKFLAAVLLGGGDNGQGDNENENADDEDEDNDADFEIEIEEALESDIDENTRDTNAKDVYKKCGRRPETRQKRRQKSSSKNENGVFQLFKRPLRPLVPIMPAAPISHFSAFDGRSFMPDTAPCSWSSSAENGVINGFTPHQLGQLHCLIHEHAQLLIQVFSLCVYEPSRQNISSQVQGLILELLEKRNQALACRSVPYPGFCFRPPYIHPSVPSELPKPWPASCAIEGLPKVDAPRDYSSTRLVNFLPSNGRHEYSEREGSFHTTEGFVWAPVVSGPLLSILDVSPLHSLGRFIEDVKIAAQEYQRRYIKDTLDTRFDREPLFPSFPSFGEAEAEDPGESIPSSSDTIPSSSPSHRPLKKTLADNLIEISKKQPVTLVPKEIVKLAQRFFPLFNPALYPRKPPPAAIANRVLFTKAEDELLAMGLMECNTDWKAIQQRFLPCKSKHQIFVRQKNCCASKAPENPIKAVRRMKTSPLTADEIARIQEGLRIWKHDWTSVWNFVVPYRDPILLPRQWRIALGTQRSYKNDTANREKRRLYEAKRRKCKDVEWAAWKIEPEKVDYQIQNAAENNSGDDSIENEDESYVHEAFLADWRPGASTTNSSELSANSREKHLSGDISQAIHVTEQASYTNEHMESQSQSSNRELAAALQNSQHSCSITQVGNLTTGSVEPNHLFSDSTLKSVKSPIGLWPYQGRRHSKNAKVVKLAPDLPPLNLPPSVRVISQSAFKSYQCGASAKVSVAASNMGSARVNNVIHKHLQLKNLGTLYSNTSDAQSNALKLGGMNSHLEGTVLNNKCIREHNDAESDLQMHPLLFKSPEERGAPYYPANCSTKPSSSFSFFSGNKPQDSLSLFHNTHQADPPSNPSHISKTKKSSSSSFGIDFHPLLQRADDIDSNPVNKCLLATGVRPSCPYEKANELDLEIHLSSTSKRKRPAGAKDIPEYASMSSTMNSDSTVAPINPIAEYRMDHAGEQSLPEIVMEQEELSDSDEETGEHVEFECEEMADSDGDEGSDREQTGNEQNKETPNSGMDKLLADCDDQGGQDHGKELTSGSLWLSLDSSSSGYPHAKAKESAKSKDPAIENPAPSRRIRSYKKKPLNNNKVIAPKHAVDTLEQFGPGAMAVTNLKKPRKRVCKTNINLNTSTHVERSDHVGNCKFD